MTIFVIKIIACVTMIIDHIRYAIPVLKKYFVFKYFGRISFPLFAFCLVEGYKHTSNLGKYIKRLMVFALISQIPYMFFISVVNKCNILEVRKLNIMFTLLMGIISIILYEKCKNKYIGFLLVVFEAILGFLLKVDYSWFGVMLCFILFISRDNKKRQVVLYVFLVLIYYAYLVIFSYMNNSLPINLYEFIRTYKKNILSVLFTIMPIIVFCIYNGKKGKEIKGFRYFYYIFYPVSCLIFYLISLI